MKASEAIIRLQELIIIHGDLPLVKATMVSIDLMEDSEVDLIEFHVGEKAYYSNYKDGEVDHFCIFSKDD